MSVAIQHLSSVPLAPSDIREDVPKALELICMKAMCANINKRYSTATEMLEDLESFRKNPNLDLEHIREELTEQEDTRAHQVYQQKRRSTRLCRARRKPL